jgi:carbamoyl-phosphate synthase large subunit
LQELGITDEPVPKHFSVKESVFPFRKFAGVDIVLGPEMRSTGEVMGISPDLPLAFAKSQIAAGVFLPSEGNIFLSVSSRHRGPIPTIAKRLHDMGYRLSATSGTAMEIEKHGIPVTRVKKLAEGNPNLIDYLKNDDVSLIINTPSGKGARTDEGKIRAAAVQFGVPCITTVSAAEAAVNAIEAMRTKTMDVLSLQERFAT